MIPKTDMRKSEQAMCGLMCDSGFSAQFEISLGHSEKPLYHLKCELTNS